MIAWVLIVLQLSSCATTALWKKTETPLYVVVRTEDISEETLKEKGVRYITNEQAGVYYIVSSETEKLKGYTYRALGTPVAVVVDAAAIVVVAYLVYLSPGSVYPETGFIFDKGRLNGNIEKLDKLATKPGAEAAVISKLVKEFGVTPEAVAGLRGQSLGYGEITAVLTFASRMTGGCTESNFNIVIELRKTTNEWIEVARILAADLEQTWSKIYFVRLHVNEIMKDSARSRTVPSSHGGNQEAAAQAAGVETE